MVQAARHAHEAQHIERHKGDEEAGDPAPEGTFAQTLVQLEAEGFREPEGEASQIAEHRATNDGVVEVGNQEQAVVQHVVSTRYGQQNAGHAAHGEGHHKAQGPQHRRGELHAAAKHGEQPVEQLHPGRHRNDHGGHAEERVDVGTRAHGEEVMQPDHEAQYGDRSAGPDHRGVAEQFLAGEGRNHLREDTERRQDEDVHLGVTPGPEQVDVHHGVAAKLVGEKMHVQIAVQTQQRQSGGQNREGRNDQDVGEGAGPGEDRHFHQRHARRAHLEYGHQEVDAGQQRP